MIFNFENMELAIVVNFVFLLYVVFIHKSVLRSVPHGISIDSCNCLKGLIAISVVLHHIAQSRDVFILKELFGPLGSVAVGCFFFISGYGLYASYSIKKQSYLDGFILKRFRKLMVPFIFVILLYQLVNQGSYEKIFSGLVVGNSDYLLPYSWYIFCAILFYYAFYFIFKYILNEKIKIFSVFIFTLIFYFVLRFVLNWPGFWSGSLFLFPIGVFFKYSERYLKKMSGLHIIMFSLWITTLIIILYLTNIKYIGIIEICCSSFAIILPLTILNISSKNLIFLGSISYEIYLVQGVIFYLLRRNNVGNNISFVFMSVGFIIVLACIVKCILKYIDNKLFRSYKYC